MAITRKLENVLILPAPIGEPPGPVVYVSAFIEDDVEDTHGSRTRRFTSAAVLQAARDMRTAILAEAQAAGKPLTP